MLRLSENPLEQFKGCVHLPSLRVLSANEGQIKTLEGLDLPMLEDLNLAGQQIEKLEGLQNSPQLTRLNLSDNHIHQIDANLNWSHLCDLDLSRNKLETLYDLPYLPSLKKLNLAENQIQQIHAADLARFPALQTLELKNNPVNNLPPKLLGDGAYSNYNCLTDLQQWFAKLAVTSVPNANLNVND